MGRGRRREKGGEREIGGERERIKERDRVQETQRKSERQREKARERKQDTRREREGLRMNICTQKTLSVCSSGVVSMETRMQSDKWKSSEEHEWAEPPRPDLQSREKRRVKR